MQSEKTFFSAEENHEFNLILINYDEPEKNIYSIVAKIFVFFCQNIFAVKFLIHNSKLAYRQAGSSFIIAALPRYVIVHELLHFNVPNHGKLWKSLMTAYLGDYEKIELKLKKIVNEERSQL